ncbi:phosphatase PAP2 family protein [Sphaerotilus uruguayifluvii]|uniref:Membrane-associated phospholipid phosphatase n=1 Tax=Sphaerotilus uruguayifluvii TaxID=2735897 RepID=A0ABX2G6E5_9BURK|nr:phosphatase PAP2 family protein [Leptothrix sp. C29]NRT57901.1 membrane-associated phospholipid phosphatase [Leptothrix sp. C29]
MPAPDWPLITRLGEAQILLPLMGVLLLRLMLHAPSRALAWRWLGGTTLAALLTTASKVAFLGFGLGLASVDFTGFSGHSMFSAAVLPWLIALLRVPASRPLRAVHLLPGLLLAALIAVSRVEVGAHSWSEVITGHLLGLAVSAWVLPRRLVPLPQPGRAWLAPLLLGALLWLPLQAPPTRTHDLVIRLSLWVSGHERPHERTLPRPTDMRPEPAAGPCPCQQEGRLAPAHRAERESPLPHSTASS